MSIEFSDETRAMILDAITRHVRDQLGQDIGVLQAQLMLDFMVGLVGAAAYNQAVSDMQAWMQHKIADLEGDLHEPVEYGV